MPRKNDKESAISLFSFQDIITSITGIMFLVVLLLVLLMITSRMPTTGKNSDNEIIRELQKEAADLKAKLHTVRQSRLRLDNQINKLKKLSPEEIARRKAKILEAVVILESDLEDLTRSFQEKTAKNNRLGTERKNLLKICDQRQKLIKDLQKELQNLEELIQEKQKKQQQRKRIMQFIVYKSTSKSPVIAQLDKDGVCFMELASGKLVDLRRPGLAHESLNLFAGELAKFDPLHVYFSIAVKPGGFKYAVEIFNILKSKGFDRGTEILPDDNVSVFEEHTP